MDIVVESADPIWAGGSPAFVMAAPGADFTDAELADLTLSWKWWKSTCSRT